MISFRADVVTSGPAVWAEEVLVEVGLWETVLDEKVSKTVG